MVEDLLELFCRAEGLFVDRAAFRAFEEALYEANARMNLTRVPREECALRHFVDSLLPQRWIPIGADVLDIGTGPGFPAWPLACARPDLRVVALDSSGKMLGFLRSQPLPNLEVVQDRAESWAVREAFDVVTGRAIAPLGVQLELSAPPCRIGGLVMPFRTPADSEAVERFPAQVLGLSLESVERASLPVTSVSLAPPEAHVVRLFPRFRKIRQTPAHHPRPWPEIRKRPLG
jgi:16S rRNA (guanine527-N7)-methyltransferase